MHGTYLSARRRARGVLLAAGVGLAFAVPVAPAAAQPMSSGAASSVRCTPTGKGIARCSGQASNETNSGGGGGGAAGHKVG